MNYNDIIKDLTAWLEDLKRSAKLDEPFTISWFKGTENYPFSIIGGWTKGFSDDYADLLCVSESESEYAMCVKIAINEGSYAYTDYEIMNMPYDEESGNVDDTEVALEWDDDSESLATWLLTEWERIMKEHGEEI